MDPTTMKAHAEGLGLSWDEIKQGLARIIPLVEPFVRLTSNTYDDAALQFIKSILAASQD